MNDHTYLILTYLLITVFFLFIVSMIIYSGIMINMINKDKDNKNKKEDKNLNIILLVSNILLLMSSIIHYFTRPLRTKGPDFKKASTISLIFILVSFCVTLGFAIYFSKSKEIEKNHPSLILLYITLAFYLPLLGKIIKRFFAIKNMGKDTEESDNDAVTHFIQNGTPTYGFRRFVARGRRGRW